jgi:putative ATPase
MTSSQTPDLFDLKVQNDLEKESPLANRMRPTNLDEFVGQEHLIGKGRLLRKAIEADRINSLIFSGPPGTGKTTLASIIANSTKSHFDKLNAVTSNVAEIRKVIEDAKNRRKFYNQKTILFVDEIHRFNKSQQDALLPDVEAGRIVLIGATTENPYFSIISALVSRSQVFEFKALETKDLEILLDRALTLKKGLGDFKIQLDANAREHLINMAGGDARVMLNGLELVVLTSPQNKDGKISVTVDLISDSIQKKPVIYTEDTHYDVISAFIKSLRGSDPDAAIYWLAKMIYAGEDPLFIARRLVILASEDIGNADPQALPVATAALTAVQNIGMPEGRIILAQAVTYLASAPKSNASYLAINKALEEIKAGVDLKVPKYLKQTPVYSPGEAKQQYQYPHDFPGHYVKQKYLTEEKTYYEPSEEGREKDIKDRLNKLPK